MPLWVSRYYFSLPGHCGFEPGLGSMGLGRWGGLYLDPPFFKIQRADTQKFWTHTSRVEVVWPRSALEFQSSRLHSQTHSGTLCTMVDLFRRSRLLLPATILVTPLVLTSILLNFQKPFFWGVGAKRGIISRLGIQIIMKFVSGLVSEYYLPLGVNSCYFKLSGHCGFKPGPGCMGLGWWGGPSLDPPFLKIQRADTQKFCVHPPRVEVLGPRSALEFQSSRLHSQIHCTSVEEG